MNGSSISVIINIYNVVDFLSQCIQSVINQSVQCKEIILVDDGSVDGCSELCDEYAKTDTKIKVIHQSNRGLAQARNIGLEESTGDWILFIDGDDWISPNMIETICNETLSNEIEVVRFGFYLDYNSMSIAKTHKKFSDKESYIKAVLERSTYLSMWLGLFKKRLFYEISPIFTEGLNFGEDYSVLPRLLYYAKGIAFIESPLYHYRQNNLGYVRNFNWKYVPQLIDCEKIVDLFYKNRGDLYSKERLLGKGDIKMFIIGRMLSSMSPEEWQIHFVRDLYANEDLSAVVSIGKRVTFQLFKSKFGLLLLRFLTFVRKFIMFLFR